MTRVEYKEQLRKQLEGMDVKELKAFAREHGVRLYSKVPYNMVGSIVEVMTSREFHGDVFRRNPIDSGVKMDEQQQIVGEVTEEEYEEIMSRMSTNSEGFKMSPMNYSRV